MKYQYISAEMSKKYAYFRIPKILFTEKFAKMSIEAKMFYGMLLDRVDLSVKNGWIDEDGHVYVIFTRDELMEEIGCATAKAAKIMDEVVKFSLVKKKVQGFGKPALLYVMEFVDDNIESNCSANVKRFENQTSRGSKIELQEVRKSNTNNTDINNPDKIKTDSSIYPPLSPLEKSEEKVAVKGEEYDFSKHDNVSNFHHFWETTDNTYLNIQKGGEIYEQLESWFEYKNEKGKTHTAYTKTGMKSLLSQVDKCVSSNGVEAVVNAIERSIGGQYMGIAYNIATEYNANKMRNPKNAGRNSSGYRSKFEMMQDDAEAYKGMVRDWVTKRTNNQEKNTNEPDGVWSFD